MIDVTGREETGTMIEWKDPSDVNDTGNCSQATVAGLVLTADGNGAYSISRQRCEKPLASGRVLKWSGARKSAKDAAEITAMELLRELHTELVAHFAPVLRWTHGERESTARLGPWWLDASDESWSVGVASSEWVTQVRGSRGPTTRANNCSAAETSLRSLGVTFRTEDGQ